MWVSASAWCLRVRLTFAYKNSKYENKMSFTDSVHARRGYTAIKSFKFDIKLRSFFCYSVNCPNRNLINVHAKCPETNLYLLNIASAKHEGIYSGNISVATVSVCESNRYVSGIKCVCTRKASFCVFDWTIGVCVGRRIIYLYMFFLLKIQQQRKNWNALTWLRNWSLSWFFLLFKQRLFRYSLWDKINTFSTAGIELYFALICAPYEKPLHTQKRAQL